MRPLWDPFPPFCKMVPFTIIRRELNKRIQWCMQRCFVNCRAWDDIITVLLGRVDTLLLGFVLDLNLGGRQKILVFFPLTIWGLLKSSWLLLDNNLIGVQQFIHSTHVNLGLPICRVFCMLGIHWWMRHTTSMDYFHCPVGPPGSKQPMPCCWNMTSQSTKDETTPAQKG